MTPRDDFVRCAQGQVGKPYVWATAGPATFDCSGLVAFCYRKATGKDITRSSYDQIHLGKNISAGYAVEPGDLAFWDTEHNGRAGHVGIVIDGAKVVSAMNPSLGVMVSDSIYANFGGPFMGVRRLFDDAEALPQPSLPTKTSTPDTSPPARPPHRGPERERERDRRRFWQRVSDTVRRRRVR